MLRIFGLTILTKRDVKNLEWYIDGLRDELKLFEEVKNKKKKEFAKEVIQVK